MIVAKSIWNDPVWSKVIAGGILAAAGLVITYLLHLWPAIGTSLRAFYDFLLAPGSVPHWLIGIGIVTSCLVLVIVVVIVWQIFSPSTQSDNQKTWRSYLSDRFFDMRWRWRYDDDGSIYNLH